MASSDRRLCPVCQQMLPDGALICPNDGTAITEPLRDNTRALAEAVDASTGPAPAPRSPADQSGAFPPTVPMRPVMEAAARALGQTGDEPVPTELSAPPQAPVRRKKRSGGGLITTRRLGPLVLEMRARLAQPASGPRRFVVLVGAATLVSAMLLFGLNRLGSTEAAPAPQTAEQLRAELSRRLATVEANLSTARSHDLPVAQYEGRVLYVREALRGQPNLKELQSLAAQVQNLEQLKLLP